MTRVIILFILISIYLSTTLAWMTFPMWAGESTNQTWEYWNTRVGLGRINFPTSLEVPIAFPIDYGLGCQIVIPMDDVANDEEFVRLPTQPKCPKDAEMPPTDRISWMNPENWYPMMTRSVNPATPHLERIPCNYEYVTFPRNGDYVVLLPNTQISIQTMSYEGKIVNAHNFHEIARKESFLKHFLVQGAQDPAELFNFTGKDCIDTTGCVCGTTRFYTEVCAIVKRTCNLTLPCSDPVTPFGHCCPMCGAYAQITFDPQRFVIRKLYMVILTKLFTEPDQLRWHLSKVSDGLAHLIVTAEDGYKGENIRVITEDLLNDLVKKDDLGIISHTLTPSSTQGPKSWLNAIYVVLLILGCAVLLVSCYFFSSNVKLPILAKLSKQTARFEKLDSIAQDNIDQLEIEEKEREVHHENENLVEVAENEAIFESDGDVFEEVDVASDVEGSLLSSSKTIEEVGILIDTDSPGIRS